MEPELFYYRIRKHFAGDPFYLGMYRRRVKRVGQSNYKIFPLPNVLNALILHLFKGAMDGLSLWVENRLLGCDIDMSLHFA
jgi:hypothetical protein